MSQYHKIESEVNEITLDLNYEHQYILDLGGGGEGVISQLFGNNVISLDKKKEELEDLKTESIKMVGDMTQLPFIDNQFSMMTAFFSFMYLSKEEVINTLKEVKRVLKPGGSIHIWDVNFPDDFTTGTAYAQYLKIKCPSKEIDTAYGSIFKEQVRDKLELVKLLEDFDFDIFVDKDSSKDTYEIVAMKF